MNETNMQTSYNEPHSNSWHSWFSYFCTDPSRVPRFTVTAEAAGKTMICSADAQGVTTCPEKKKKRIRFSRKGAKDMMVRCFGQVVMKACRPLVTALHANYRIPSYVSCKLYSLETSGNNSVKKIEVRFVSQLSWSRTGTVCITGPWMDVISWNLNISNTQWLKKIQYWKDVEGSLTL